MASRGSGDQQRVRYRRSWVQYYLTNTNLWLAVVVLSGVATGHFPSPFGVVVGSSLAMLYIYRAHYLVNRVRPGTVSRRIHTWWSDDPKPLHDHDATESGVKRSTAAADGGSVHPADGGDG